VQTDDYRGIARSGPKPTPPGIIQLGGVGHFRVSYPAPRLSAERHPASGRFTGRAATDHDRNAGPKSALVLPAFICVRSVLVLSGGTLMKSLRPFSALQRSSPKSAQPQRNTIHSAATMNMAHPKASTTGWGRKISVGTTHATSPWVMSNLILLRECLTVRLPVNIVATGLSAAGVSASRKTKSRDRSPAPWPRRDSRKAAAESGICGLSCCRSIPATAWLASVA